MYTYGRFMLRFDQKQNNSVKQLLMKKKKRNQHWIFIGRTDAES